MNKSELIEALAEKANVSKATAGQSIDALVGIITAAVAKGDDVALVGFGTFKPAKRAARLGKNPKTGETLKIAATTVPKFSAGATFKAAVAGKKAATKKAPAKAPAKVAAKKPVAKKK
jgi:DNA-binding protein HU-beta